MTDELIEKVLAGEPRAVARAISRIENQSTDAAAIMKAVFPKAGRATVIGITGAPGAGKSSLVDKLAGKKVIHRNAAARYKSRLASRVAKRGAA